MELQRFEDIVLDGVLPPNTRLVIDSRLYNVILIRGNSLIEQIHLGRIEASLLFALLSTFPLGCTYARLIGIVKNMSEEEVHELIVDAVAREDRVGYERILRPMRTQLSRLRVDIAPVCVDIRPEKDGTYALVKPSRRNTTLYDRIKASLDTSSPGGEITPLRAI